MKQTVITELATFQEHLKEAKHFRVVVHLKGGNTITGSFIPIVAFGEYFEESTAIEEGAGFTVWIRETKAVNFIPASSIEYVQFTLA